MEITPDGDGDGDKFDSHEDGGKSLFSKRDGGRGMRFLPHKDPLNSH